MGKHLFAALASALLVAGCAPIQPSAGQQEPPPRPPSRERYGPTVAEVRKVVEEKVVERLGAEALRQAQAARTSIVASSYQGRFESGGPRVTVAVRGSNGWTSWKSGRPAPLAAAAGAELDRLLADPAFWREAPFYPEMDCPDAGATMMIVRHRGQERVTRQGCTPAGLLGRLEETVLEERVPS
jgi:hypothetical protein